MKRLKKISSKEYNIKKILELLNFYKKNKMNKTASVENSIQMVKALSDLTESNEQDKLLNLLNDIKKDDPECIYNGTVYRKMLFETADLFDELDMEKDFQTKDDIIKGIKNQIRTGEYNSSSETLSACQNFIPDDRDGECYSFIMEYNVKDGICVYKLMEKYYNLFKQMMESIDEGDFEEKYPRLEDYEVETAFINIDEINDVFGREKEVLAILPENYEIIEINGIAVNELSDNIDIDSLF